MTDTYAGTADLSTAGSEWNTLHFAIKQIVGRMATATIVIVRAVREGVVDVQPMVHQVAGDGSPVPHGVIVGIPAWRYQAGPSAIVLDPAVGDIGVAIFAHTDISKVKNTRAPALPDTRRRFDWADGIYFGGVLNPPPAQEIRLDAGGITITSLDGQPVNINAPGGANITAPTTTITGDASITGNVSVGGDLSVTGKTTTADLEASGMVSLDGATVTGTLTADTLVGTTDVLAAGKSGATHKHGSVQTGSGTSGPPA